jgi:hypothetical protein
VSSSRASLGKVHHEVANVEPASGEKSDCSHGEITYHIPSTQRIFLRPREKAAPFPALQYAAQLYLARRSIGITPRKSFEDHRPNHSQCHDPRDCRHTSLALSGCDLTTPATPAAEAGAVIKGNVHGGQQAIVGAHVYLLAAATTNYGATSTSLLTSGTAGTDSVGSYVLSDANGAFSITGDYICTPGTQVFLYAQCGNPGAGVNSAASPLAALGQCPAAGDFATATPFVWVNEVSTVTTAFGLAGFASDAHHIGSQQTPQSLLGIKTAFANVPQLEYLAYGATFGTTPIDNGSVPHTLINTLANIIAACINSPGLSSTECSTLFATARFGGCRRRSITPIAERLTSSVGTV